MTYDMNSLKWTDERIELLKVKWAEGLSSSQIAAQMGGCTRNSIIGKVHRLGLHQSAPRFRNQPGPKKATRQAKVWNGNAPPRPVRPRLPIDPIALAEMHKAVAAKFVAKEHKSTEPHKACDMFALTDYVCRWPLWGGREELNKLYCGAPTNEKPPYCREHAKMATNSGYVPIHERQRSMIPPPRSSGQRKYA